jgi:hypothetical protein
MQSTRDKSFSLLLALVLGGASLPALADDACVDFKWDVSKERALFAETPAKVTAGKDPRTAPVVVPNRLYRLKLMAQDTVAFSVTNPAKKTTSTPAYAGLAMLKVPVTGSYRIAVDLPLWIDVAANGALVQPADFQAQHACNAPHKIVEFDLAGAQPFVLQFSNAGKDDVLLTVTPSPPRKL